MKRDKFEELLHDKLGRTEVTPPADMWARLEARLPDINRELAFGMQERQPAADVLPTPRIRRPLRQKMRWAYVAASIAVAAVMVFSIRNLEEADMIAERGGKAETETGITVVEPVTQTGIDSAKDGPEVIESNATIPVYATNINSRPASAITVATDGTDDTYTVKTGVDDTTSMDVNPEIDRQRTNPATGVETDARQRTENKEEITSDTSGQEEFAAFMARAIANDGRRERRTGPVRAASLYAVNGTGLTGSGTVTGRVKLQKSSLIVTETTELPGEETASGSSSSTTTSQSLKHDLPLGFGASVNFGLTRRLSIETGLTYTYMRSKGETTNPGAKSIATQKLHYLGLPVKVNYDFFQSRFVNLYGGAGFAVEKLLSGKINYVDYYNGDAVPVGTEKPKVGSLQTSVGANVGVQINIDKTFGLYVEPGVGYFFENSNQPESYRTENPFNFTIKAGFRINL